MPKILLVEDDKSISKMLVPWLEAENYLVDLVETGNAALDYITSFQYDLVILDVQLPDLSGIEICRSYRKKSKGPVLMLTGLDAIDDKVVGLDAGADDYLTKPFDSREFMARVRAQIRREQGDSQKVFTAHKIMLDCQSRTVEKNGKRIALTPKEFDVLEFFMRNPNTVITPDALLKRIWSSDSEASPHAVYNCLNRLRKNLDASNKEAVIKTVHGSGYRLEV